MFGDGVVCHGEQHACANGALFHHQAQSGDGLGVIFFQIVRVRQKKQQVRVFQPGGIPVGLPEHQGVFAVLVERLAKTQHCPVGGFGGVLIAGADLCLRGREMGAAQQVDAAKIRHELVDEPVKLLRGFGGEHLLEEVAGRIVLFGGEVIKQGTDDSGKAFGI